MVGLAGGIIAGIGGVTLKITDDFSLAGIALGTILVIVYYHLVNGRGGVGSGTVTRVLSHPDEPVHTHEPGRTHDPATGREPGAPHEPGHRAGTDQE
jgi:hypothetical protein